MPEFMLHRKPCWIFHKSELLTLQSQQHLTYALKRQWCLLFTVLVTLYKPLESWFLNCVDLSKFQFNTLDVINWLYISSNTELANFRHAGSPCGLQQDGRGQRWGKGVGSRATDQAGSRKQCLFISLIIM